MNRNKDRGDHPDQRINRNIEEGSLNNNGNDETESTNLNTDVTGASVTTQGGSSSGNDDVSRKRILNPLEQNVVGHIQNVDGETVPAVYAAYVAPQTTQEAGVEVGESSDHITITNHNLQKRSPIGLNLRLTASLINEIESTLNKHNKEKGQYKENRQLPLSQLDSKFRASNMPAMFLKIGGWKWASKNEGDLVVKFYYGRKRLAWEVLVGDRKKKIDIRWSQISAINTFVDEDNKGRLEIELSESPEFYKEINFPAKKHTQWEATKDDFTNGQASICRRHTVVFQPRVLDEPFMKLLQSDSRLFNLNQQPFPAHNYPHFQNLVLDFSCNSVNGFSSHKDVNNVQPDNFFVGNSSFSNLPIQVSNFPYLDEKATRVSYKRITTTGVLEQSGNNQIQEIPVAPLVNQDIFLQNRGMESWTSSHLPEHTNESTPMNQSYDQMNYMTSLDQAYLNNGMFPKGPDLWLCPDEGRVGFNNSGGSSSSRVMDHMPYEVDDETFMKSGLSFQEAWTGDYCLNEFYNGGNVNRLNQMGYADNGIQSFGLSAGNGDDVLFPNSNFNSNSSSNSKSKSNFNCNSDP